jgi:2-keto-4-pentenoate hydratase
VSALESHARRLDAAAAERAPIAQLSRAASLTIDDAYAVQRRLVEHRCARG